MLYAADFRKIARQALNGHWGSAILAGLIVSFLGGSVFGTSPAFNFNFTEEDMEIYSDWIYSDLGQKLMPIFSGVAIALIVWAIIVMIIGGAVSLGYARYNLTLVDQQPVSVGEIFSDFRIGAGFCMRFLRGLYTFLWSLLFVIPGIIATYSYAMAPYIMAEHPEYSASQAIRLSKEMMRGNRWRLFCMNFSFIGWEFLSVFTLGIGALWLKPYIEASNAVFYREISGTVPSYQAGNYFG